MRIAISIAVMIAVAACGDDVVTDNNASRDAGPVDGATNSPPEDAANNPPIDASDAQPPDAAVDAAPDAAMDAAPDADAGSEQPDSGPVEYGVSGCWITHTMNGETQLDLVEQSDGQVTGTQSYQQYMYPVENGVVDENGLVFTVNWSDFSFTCSYTFTEVSADALSGTAVCGGTSQDITADRTCI